MSISFFGRETKYQSQLEKLNQYFKFELNIFSTLQKAVSARATLDFDYAKGALIIVNELEKQIKPLFNKNLKSGLRGLCQDWRNMALQKQKIANEFEHIAQNDIKLFIQTYRVSASAANPSPKSATGSRT